MKRRRLMYDRTGFGIRVARWWVAYWTPKAPKPFTIRQRMNGHIGWWGALRITKMSRP